MIFFCFKNLSVDRVTQVTTKINLGLAGIRSSVLVQYKNTLSDFKVCYCSAGLRRRTFAWSESSWSTAESRHAKGNPAKSVFKKAVVKGLSTKLLANF